MYLVLVLVLSFIIGLLLANAAVHKIIPFFLHPNLTVIIVVLILTVTVIITGIIVRRYQQSKLPQLTGIVASYILAFAQSCVIAGIALTSLWTGQLVGSYEIWNIIFTKFNSEAWAIGASTCLIFAGMWTVEQCKIRKDDNSSTKTTPSPPLSPSAV